MHGSRCWIALEDTPALDVRAGDIVVQHPTVGSPRYTVHRDVQLSQLMISAHRATLKPVDLSPA